VEEYGQKSALHVIVEWRQIMKLNKYIIKKLHETWPEKGIPSEEDMEDWITDWYMESFKEINSGKDGKPRAPPIWLAGRRWYDRRQDKIDEANLL
jgi:hypothetical protein